MRRWPPAIAAIASGALMAAAFPPLSCSPLIVVGVALLLAVVRRKSFLTALWLGFVAGISGFALAVGWLWPTIATFTGASTTAVAVFAGAVVLYHAFQVAAFTAIASFLPQEESPARTWIGLAALWVVVEWSYPQLVPWSLGDGCAGSPRWRQAADLAGVHGLSFSIVFAAAALSSPRPDRRRGFVVAAFVLASMAAYGHIELGSDWGSGRSLGVAALQGGLGPDVAPQLQNELAWKIYEPLTLRAAATRAASLVVWPETVLRSYLRYDRRQLERLRALAQRIGSDLLVGAQDLGPSGGGDLNAAFLISREAETRLGLQAYHKAILLPFGEYVPGGGWLPFSNRWPTTGSYIPGSYGGPLELDDGVKIGPSICFEAMQPGGSNRMVADGAMVLVNLSDDSRFAGVAARRQHLGGAVMRAVETRRWLVRTSDSGISAIIDPAGRVVDMLDFGAVGGLHVDVPLRDARSMYVYCGDWLVLASALILLERMCIAAALRATRVTRAVFRQRARPARD